jgi:hypothetical protein
MMHENKKNDVIVDNTLSGCGGPVTYNKDKDVEDEEE